MISKLIDIAKGAGRRIMEVYSGNFDVDFKDDHSPLTQADRLAHQHIVGELGRFFPQFPVLSEESPAEDIKDRRSWKQYFLVDPLDGTKEFVKRNGEFTVNIAFIEDGIPTAGVVLLPAKDITYFGSATEGSFKKIGNEAAFRIYFKPHDLSKPARVVASRSHQSDDLTDTLSRWGVQVVELVPSGSSIKICLIAEGVADIYPRLAPTMEWDTAAADAVYRFAVQKPGEVVHFSALRYNKENLLNPHFVFGLSETDYPKELLHA